MHFKHSYASNLPVRTRIVMMLLILVWFKLRKRQALLNKNMNLFSFWLWFSFFLVSILSFIFFVGMGLYGSYFQAMGLIKILTNDNIFNQ